MLVAIEVVRNASTSRPVGISNVRIVESSAEAMSHLESGEKHCHHFSRVARPTVRSSVRYLIFGL